MNSMAKIDMKHSKQHLESVKKAKTGSVDYNGYDDGDYADYDNDSSNASGDLGVKKS